MTRFTILGAGGIIGEALVSALLGQGQDVLAVTRPMLADVMTAGQPMRHVIDCIGLTGDFRSRPLDTAQAHVGITAACLGTLRCDSFLFLSSTRVYARAAATREDTALPCVPADPSDLYNLTKLAGEALCLADQRSTVRVVRLSNVYGAEAPDTFLGQVLAEGRASGAVRFHQAPDSSKDYIALDTVVAILPEVAQRGGQRLYNLAAGRNTSHHAIAATLRDAAGWDTRFVPNAPTVRFPTIDTTRLRAEFAPPLSTLLDDLPRLAAPGQEVQCSPSTRSPAK